MTSCLFYEWVDFNVVYLPYKANGTLYIVCHTTDRGFFIMTLWQIISWQHFAHTHTHTHRRKTSKCAEQSGQVFNVFWKWFAEPFFAEKAKKSFPYKIVGIHHKMSSNHTCLEPCCLAIPLHKNVIHTLKCTCTLRVFISGYFLTVSDFIRGVHCGMFSSPLWMTSSLEWGGAGKHSETFLLILIKIPHFSLYTRDVLSHHM